jgi:hypothetical protein
VFIDFDNGGTAIGHVEKRRAADRTQFGRTINLRWLHLSVTRHCGAVGDSICEERFGRLLRSRDAGLHVFFRTTIRNVGKIRRKPSGGHVLPGAIERRCAEPSPGNQHIRLLIGQESEHIASCVGDIKQVRAVDRDEIGFSIEHDEFCRLGRNVNLRGRILTERRWRIGSAFRWLIERIDWHL